MKIKNSLKERVRDVMGVSFIAGGFVLQLGIIGYLGQRFMNEIDTINFPVKKEERRFESRYVSSRDLEGRGYATYYGDSKNPREVEFRSFNDFLQIGNGTLSWLETRATAYDYDEDGIFDKIEKDEDFSLNSEKLKKFLGNVRDSANIIKEKHREYWRTR